jgi:tRNA threonylcarbamoyladenosine biosynthesis protein TsaE
MSEIFTTKSAAETIEFGRRIGETLKGGELILLYGELGGGKTQFTKGLALGLGVTETVISPTFTIERIYRGKSFELHHLDLYRTHDDREMLEEIREFTGSKKIVTVIEWPENLADLSEMNAMVINFEYVSDNERKITIKDASE